MGDFLWLVGVPQLPRRLTTPQEAETQEGKLRQSLVLSAPGAIHKDIRPLSFVVRYVVNKGAPVQPMQLHAQGTAECQ